MKTRTALALLILGIAILTSGMLFKFLHWPSANIQVLLGSIVQITALLTLAINVSRMPSPKELMSH